jgi:hypothetical protein
MWVSRQQAERIYAATAARLAWLEAHAEQQAKRLAEAERLLHRLDACVRLPEQAQEEIRAFLAEGRAMNCAAFDPKPTEAK